MSADFPFLSPQQVTYRSKQPAIVQRLTPGVSQEPTQPLFSSHLGSEGSTVLTLGDMERRSGLYILGRTGMGKSTLLVNLALQDMEHGHGVFFLDPHEDAIRDLMKRLPRSRKDDVLLFDVRDNTQSFGINLVACANPSDLGQREDTFVKAYEVFHSLWSVGRNEWGPWLELIIAYLLRALIENPGSTLAAAPDFLTDADFRKMLVANIRYNPQVANFWQKQFAQLKTGEQAREIQAALTRVDQLLADPYVRHVIGQGKTTLDFSKLMQERKIVLVSFPANLPSNTRRFLGTILVRELLWAARARGTDRSQFCVFVDEFQNFVTPDFASIIRETRKFGLAPTIAQQFSLGIEYLGVNEAIDAMANLVIFQPTVKDAERTAKEFADRPTSEWLEVLSEEERVVVADEWLERIVDKVENGVEPIPTLAQQPLTHLLRGHGNQEVNRLTGGALQRLADALQLAQAETEQASLFEKASPEPVFHHRPDGESGTEFVATREQMLAGKQEIDRLFFDLEQGSVLYGSREAGERLVAIAQNLRGLIGFAQGAAWETKGEDRSWTETRYNRFGEYQVPHIRAASAGNWVDVPLSPRIAHLLPEIVAAVAREAPQALEEESSLVALPVLSRTQQAFEQAVLLDCLQENKAKCDEQVIDCLRIPGDDLLGRPFVGENAAGYESFYHFRRRIESGNKEYTGALAEDPGVKVLTKRAESFGQLWEKRKEAIGAVSPFTIAQQRELSPIRDKENEAEREQYERMRQLMKNDQSAIENHAVSQTIQTVDDLFTPPSGLTPVARNAWTTAQQQALSELVTRRTVAQAEYRRLVAFLTELSKLCVALSVPEQQIVISSNQYQPRIETKLTYVMRPEKAYTKAARTLTHPRRAVADLVAEKERDLLDLAPYTAAYKLLSEAGGAPRKGVLSTFALCDEHPYYILYGLRRIVSAASQKYSMLREEIEKEIREQRRSQTKPDDETVPSRYDHS